MREVGPDGNRPRRRKEQAIADRFGRMFTDPMPLPLLEALARWEEMEPGKIWELLADTQGAMVRVMAESFWSAFWRDFQAAQAAKRAAPTEKG